MEYIPDNYDLWAAHEREAQHAEEKAEKCAWCGEPIWDGYYDIGGDHVCEDCIDGCRRYLC